MLFDCNCSTGFTIIGSILALTIGCFIGAFLVSLIKEELRERKKKVQEQGEDLTRYVMNFAVRAKLLQQHDVSNHRLEAFTRKYNYRKRKMEIK